MENLEVKGDKGTYYIPEVKFDAKSGQCEISGESYLEDTLKFYEPILKWLDQFKKESVNTELDFKFRLSYFNTSSSRCISMILQRLKSFEDAGGILTVVWYYNEEDDDMIEEIEDFVEETGVEIAMIPLATTSSK